MFTRIGRVISHTLASALGRLAVGYRPPPNAGSATDTVKRNAVQVERRPGWYKLIWSSGHMGPAYRITNPQGREVYVPLAAVKPQNRIPRCVRRRNRAAIRRLCRLQPQWAGRIL